MKNVHLQPKKDMSVGAPIMHPIFANADTNQVPPQNAMMNPAMTDPMMNMNQGMYGQQPPSTQYYQPQQQAHDTNVLNNNQINYSNFSNFPGAQQAEPITYPIAEPVPHVKEAPPPRVKLPLPEEFIHFQTVFEELKNHCIHNANNPVG